MGPLPSKAVTMTTTIKKPNSAFMAPLKPSDALAAAIGPEAVPRTEITKKIWAYIKSHNLQDEKNKRLINADANLQKVFGKPQVTMFEMTKLLQPHLAKI
jgi:chromatin remodeling complex protein RSC6